MIELIHVPQQCICNRVIPVEKIFSGDHEELLSVVNSIFWYAVLRPSNFHSEKVVTSDLRYEEIQIIQVDITDTDRLFEVARTIYKKILYPCLLIICHKAECTKYIISACRFTPGKNDYDKNVLKSLVMSHWIHPDCLSENAKQFIDSLNRALEQEGNLFEIYSALHQAIAMFKMSGTSKTHAKQIIDYLCGKGENPKAGSISKILRFCTPYHFYASKHQSRADYYSSNKKESQSYSVILDYEDIWYCFLRNDYIRGYIERNHYRDIDYLVYRVDEKLFESRM